jgi:hypothetical protein
MRAAWSIAALLGFASAAVAAPTADQVFANLGFTASEKQRVLQGEYVRSKIASVSERDLSFAVAFFVKSSPEELSKQIVAGKLISADPEVKAYGALSTPGSPADFSALQLDAEEIKSLAHVEAGDKMNRSTGEIALAREHRGDSAQAVREQLVQMLLARYQAYRASGFAGIASYDRGAGHSSDVASDLKKATEWATMMQAYMPAFYGALLDYPRARPAGLQESFFWSKSDVQGKPTYVLVQILVSGEGAARAIVRREFYVSGGYNAEQSIAGFLPVEGGTIVAYASHAFTDQVAGAGSSMKRSIGSRVMADQMKKIFDAARKRVEQ